VSLKELLRGNDKEMKALEELGLSSGESKLYLHLLSQPEGEALDKAVAGFGLPEEVAEDSLKSLADKGLVRVSRNRVEAVQPRLVLQTILEQRRKSFENQIAQENSVASALEKILEPIYWENRMGVRSEEIIEPLRDLADMEVRTARMLVNATGETFIFAETFGWYEKIREALYQAHDRGVRIRILMMASDELTRKRAKELQSIGVQVRHCTEEWYPVRGTLVDDQELIFLIWATRKRDVLRPVYYRPHYTKNAGLIRIFRDAFHHRWEEGREVGP
jgi:sugar-specific transcriptional regulator TrmB